MTDSESVGSVWTQHGAHALLGALSLLLATRAVHARDGCPERAAVERELRPLLDRDSAPRESSTAIGIADLGESYRVTVGDAERLIHDPLRDCDERAKVSAVFIALNLPTQSQPKAAPATATTPTNETAVASADWRVSLRALAGFEHAPEPAKLATGLALGAALGRGPWGVGLSAGLQTPTTIVVDEHATLSYELWRLPAALTWSYSHDAGTVGAGLESGVAFDVLHFRGESVPNRDSALRLNVGLRLSLALKLRANRSLSALLLPTFAYYPRTYLVRLEPSRLLGESPRFWWGAAIGLESSVLGG